MLLSKPIHNITPFTLLDYPDKAACIIWFAGCNMACSYCYNPEIVSSNGTMSYGEALKFLEKRKGLLDAVVLSGGEATRAKGLLEFARKVKELGYLIKLDTNGSMPGIVSEMIVRRLVDYVALDFKSLSNDFYRITKSKLFSRFEKVLTVLMESDVFFEVRTTFHDGLLTVNNLAEMSNYLSEKKYKGVYYVQHFFNGTKTIDSLQDSHYRLDPNLIRTEGVEIQIRN